jgi:hypothetical protein
MCMSVLMCECVLACVCLHAHMQVGVCVCGIGWHCRGKRSETAVSLASRREDTIRERNIGTHHSGLR